MTEQNKRFWVIAGIVLVAVFSRLLPHPYNFTPVAAIALFSGAYFMERKWAFAVPVLAMLLSDVLLQVLFAAGYREYPGFYPDMVFVYGGFALVVFVGTGIAGRVSLFSVCAASLTASVLFFLVTNFGAWLALPVYPRSVAGLLEAYVAGIPFFRWTMLGDLVYSAIIFGAFETILLGRPEWKRVSSR